jgi:antitoxin (DNA-binding transcriptional repressor) of toxin-antitoxin stability system
MQTTVAVEDIKVSVDELLQSLQPGDELILTKGQQPVAKLVSQAPKPPRPAPGLGKGSIIYMAPDFDGPIEEMKDYME